MHKMNIYENDNADKSKIVMNNDKIESILQYMTLDSDIFKQQELVMHNNTQER